MPKINWVGTIHNEKEFPKATVPKDSIKLDSKSVSDILFAAGPFAIIPFIVCLLAMILKTKHAASVVIDFTFLPLGVLLGLLLIPIHELLHAIAYPKTAEVKIGIMPKNIAMVALSSSPIKRERFIFMSLLPTLLGVIPLILFLISDPENHVINSVYFSTAAMGLFSPYPDYYNVYSVLKNCPRGCTLQNSGSETYYY